MFFLGNRARVPADPAPAPVEPAGPTVAQLQERAAAAVQLIHEHLTVQHMLEPDDRDEVLCDALLDLRNILQPGTWVLPVRPSVPVVPGGTS